MGSPELDIKVIAPGTRCALSLGDTLMHVFGGRRVKVQTFPIEVGNVAAWGVFV